MASPARAQHLPESPLLGTSPPDTGNRPETSRTNLVRILSGFCEQSTLKARVHYFVRLVEWTRSGSRSSPALEQIRRRNELLSLLEEDAALRAQFQRAFHAMLGETQSVSLFAEGVLHPRESLWTEAISQSSSTRCIVTIVIFADSSSGQTNCSGALSEFSPQAMIYLLGIHKEWI
jgi:hypothetical protein